MTYTEFKSQVANKNVGEDSREAIRSKAS